MNKREFLSFGAFFAAFFYLLGPFCNAQTDGFSVMRIHSTFNYPIMSLLPSASQEEELKQILSQPFSYLACGGQCFAFVSQDNRYVIKFFKHHFRKPYSYFYALPLPGLLDQIRNRKVQKKIRKTLRDFNSYALAYEELKEESGLIYIRLNKEHPFHQSIVIKDKLGISHSIDLNEVEFVLQKKGVLAYNYIATLEKDADATSIKAAFASILDVIVSRCKKGIFDEDPKIHRNLGFVKAEPIFIDVGRFTRDPARKNPTVYREDLKLIIKRLRKDLEETHPNLVPLLDEEMQRAMTCDV